MENDRDELDDLIDSALREYSSAGPVHGLEERVLRRIHTATTAWPYRWIFALAALILVAIVLRTWWNPVPHTANSVQPETARLKPPSLPPAPAAPSSIVPKRRHTAVRVPEVPSRVLPRQQYFPAPQAMTDEEHVLVAWAERAPLEARQAFLDLQKRSEEPVVIQSIQIPPLPSDGAQ